MYDNIDEKVLNTAKEFAKSTEVRQRKKNKKSANAKMVPKLADSDMEVNDRLKLHLNGDLSSSEDEFEISNTHALHRQKKHASILQKNHIVEGDKTFEVDLLNAETEFEGNASNTNEEDLLLNPISAEVISIEDSENSFMIALQVFFPFFAAGIGTVAAGLLLDTVQVNNM